MTVNKQAAIAGSSHRQPFEDIQGSLFHNVRLSCTRGLSHGKAYGGEERKMLRTPFVPLWFSSIDAHHPFQLL